MASNQGHFESFSGNSDPSLQRGMMGSGDNGSLPYHISIPSMQNDSAGSKVSSSFPTSQQILTSNMKMGMSNPFLGYIGSQLQPRSIMNSNHKSSNQPNSVSYNLSGGQGLSLGNLDQQVLGKRKSPAEPRAEGIASQNILVPNKRPAQLEHRPWLQPISQLNESPLHVPSSVVSPRTQYMPALSKKTVQLDPVLGKYGKQTTAKKPSAQKQILPKPQNVSFESVRSKMRDSLADALALVQQFAEPLTNFKSLEGETSDSAAQTQVSCQTIESASAASGVDAAVSDGTVFTNGECSIQNGSDYQIGGKSSDTKRGDAQESQYIYPFPHEDVSFGGNMFVKDDLLQGNGLSWVLDGEMEFLEKKETEKSEAQNSANANVEKIKEKAFQDPKLLAFKIEAELFKLFEGVNKKYKEKGRSLLFNLKDKNNPELREKVMYGEIPPERLCSMSAEELASKELSDWRQAKAEELAQMVILPETEVDIRRLVRKTHKGEFQVDFEPADSGSVEVSVGSTSLSWSQNDKKKSSSTSKTLEKRNEGNDSEGKTSRQKDQVAKPTMVSPSNEVNDSMQVITVDDDMKDATGFLPPIVSLDEFMESLNSEPPFDSPSSDVEKATPQPEKKVSEASPDPKSPQQSPSDHVGALPDESGNRILDSSKPDADVKSKTESSPIGALPAVSENSDLGSSKSDADIKSMAAAPVVPAGERIWEGVFQLSVSSVTPVIGIFRSGEKTNVKEWPVLLEVKGRVRLNAFEKFIRELRNSRSRGVMVICFVCKEGSPKSHSSILSEVAESYVTDERVGYVEPASGVELYLCPPNGKTPEIISNIVSKDQLDFFKSLDNGLVFIVVWRKRPRSNTASHRKHGSQPQQHPENNSSARSNVSSQIESHARHDNGADHDHEDVDDDDDGDVPPGFGPGDGREDDDLPEFNFSSGNPFPAPTASTQQSQSMDQVRELIHKYGNTKLPGNQNVNDDDDDDIPEWQPNPVRQPVGHPVRQPVGQPVHQYQNQMVNQVYGGSTVGVGPARPASVLHPQHSSNVSQEGSWWAHHQPGSAQHRGTSSGPGGSQHSMNRNRRN